MSETQASRPPAEAPRPSAPAAPAEPPPREKKGSGGLGFDPEGWMLTFSDLLNLLMTFFVLIFATQDPVPPEKLQQAFGQQAGVFSLFRTGFLADIVAVPRRDINMDLVQIFLDQVGATDIEVEQQARGLVIALPTDTYFEPGGARLNETARKRIDQLADFLVASRHSIRVEGHTDDRERVAAPYPGVWELSVGRAHRVLQRLLAHGINEHRLALIGYGPAHPRFSNATSKGRERNRRVEIVILNRRTVPGQP